MIAPWVQAGADSSQGNTTSSGIAGATAGNRRLEIRKRLCRSLVVFFTSFAGVNAPGYHGSRSVNNPAEQDIRDIRMSRRGIESMEDSR